MHDTRLDQVKEHLYNGLAIIDLVGHVEDPGALWRRDSLAYAMRLIFKEWQAVEELLHRLEEEQLDEWHRGPPIEGTGSSGENSPPESQRERGWRSPPTWRRLRMCSGQTAPPVIRLARSCSQRPAR